MIRDNTFYEEINRSEIVSPHINNYKKLNKTQRFYKRTQDSKKLFYDAGQFCFGKFKAWKKKNKFFPRIHLV